MAWLSVCKRVTRSRFRVYFKRVTSSSVAIKYLPIWFRSLRLVVAVWLSRPRAAGEGHQARKHGYGDVLPELGLATASLQASAAIFL